MYSLAITFTISQYNRDYTTIVKCTGSNTKIAIDELINFFKLYKM
jgi:hypothetical protein